MTADRRRKVLLAVLVGVLGIALAMQLGGDGGEAPEGVVVQPAAQPERGEATLEVVELDMGALEPTPETFAAGRDPFRFGPLPAPPPPPTPVRVERPRPAPPPPPPQPVEPPGPQPPSADHLRYLGSFGAAERRVAVVISGEDIYNVPEGGVLEGQFVIEDIGYESVTIGFVGFPEARKRLAVGG